MGTISTTTLINRAATLLQDPSHVRWTQSELLGWLNDGQRDIAAFKPTAYTKITIVQLVAGTLQNLPADGTALMGVMRNMGDDGTKPGLIVREASKVLMDAHLVNWMNATPSAVVKHFVYGAVAPKSYYVYPPQPTTGTGHVELMYAAIPEDCALNTPILLDDLYGTALVNYILYRAYAKDAEHVANVQLSTAYYQAFMSLVAGKATGENAAAAA